MARTRSPNRDKAFDIYKENKGKISSGDIAALLQENKNNIYAWKRADKWEEKLKGKVGAPPGNKNALGNKGGAPSGNVNSFLHGMYSKRIPMAVKNIMEELEQEDPLDKLWRSILLQEARIINMQKIMHVKNNKDTTKTVKKRTTQGNLTKSNMYQETEYEIQYAWDKESNLIVTQSKAMDTLAKMIKQYDDMLHSNWETVTEEQKLRVDKLKLEIEHLNKDNKPREPVKIEFVKASEANGR